jgi:hypothetical protein
MAVKRAKGIHYHVQAWSSQMQSVSTFRRLKYKDFIVTRVVMRSVPVHIRVVKRVPTKTSDQIISHMISLSIKSSQLQSSSILHYEKHVSIPPPNEHRKSIEKVSHTTTPRKPAAMPMIMIESEVTLREKLKKNLYSSSSSSAASACATC